LTKRFLSSQNRILLLVIAAISVAFLLIAYGIYTNYHNTLNDNYNRFADTITNVVSVGAVDRLSSKNPAYGIRPFTDQMVASSEDISGIEFYNAEGRLIYKSGKALHETDLANVTDYTAPLRRLSPDGIAEETIGSVHVKLSGKSLRDIKAASGQMLFWAFMSAWLISILAVSLNTYILSKHLRTFVRAVRRLSTGDFGYTILETDLWGELKELAKSFNDMSGRLRTYEEQNLETITFERNKLKAILLSLADGVIVCEISGNMTIINDAACAMLDFKSGDWAIGTNLKNYVTEDNTACFEPIIRDFEEQCREEGLPVGASGNTAQAPPLLLTHKLEMPEKTFKVMLSPIQDADKKHLLGFVLILHDVTREAEVDRMKTNFISNVSHELRTPVTTIKSYVDTLYNHGQDLDPQTYNEFIETINLETDRLKKLVNDILDFSRLEEGSVLLEREMADLAPVINLTVQSVKVLAEQKNISLTTAIESGLPRLLINSDSIERVLRNLLSNAIKYTDNNGRVKVRAELAENGEAVEVSVQDSGIGIAEEHLPHLFDRFYRVENKVHTIKGTGLGLHLVKVAVEKHHHGKIFVRSEVGVGSTFGFRLPIENTEEDAEAAS
jgi:two-component system sensor histidine kinase NblS